MNDKTKRVQIYLEIINSEEWRRAFIGFNPKTINALKDYLYHVVSSDDWRGRLSQAQACEKNGVHSIRKAINRLHESGLTKKIDGAW